MIDEILRYTWSLMPPSYWIIALVALCAVVFWVWVTR